MLPRVNVNVGEETLLAANTTIPFVPAIIMKTKSGPIGTVESITSESQFKAIFGEADYTTPSAYAIQLYLRSYSYVLITRIANEDEAALGTGKMTVETIGDILQADTNYKTDLYNGKEIQLVYDGTSNKLWLDVSAITGKHTISLKEDYTADTAKAPDFEAALNKLITSINASNLGFTLTNLYNNKTEGDSVPNVGTLSAGISLYITGGDSGNTTSVDNDKVKKLIDLYNSETNGVDVLLIPEYTNYEIVNYASDIALKNNFMVITSPKANSAQDAIQAVTNYSTNNRGSLAVYFPDVYYNDFTDNNGNLQAIPVSVAVLSTYAKTDVQNKWGAPAGVTRGTLSLVNSLTVPLTDDDLSTLYDNTIPINGINEISGKGFIVWGNKTTSAKSTFFDRINVARLVKYVTREAYEISWNYLFEPITNYVFTDWTMKIQSLLSEIQTGYGLEAYEVIMDTTINTAQTIANNQLNGIIRLKPQEVAEYINIDLTITDTINVSIEE